MPRDEFCSLLDAEKWAKMTWTSFSFKTKFGFLSKFKFIILKLKSSLHFVDCHLMTDVVDSWSDCLNKLWSSWQALKPTE